MPARYGLRRLCLTAYNCGRRLESGQRSRTLDQPTIHHTTHPHEAAHHEELGFWRKYVFSLDHKVIGIQYAVTGLLFLMFGFTLMMIMRWQLAYPGQPIPFIGNWFGADKAPGGIMLPEFYNQLGAMHGTIMVFLGVVPLAVGGFGNFVVPLQIGAPDMAFPKLNMMSYWVYFLGGMAMLASFFLPGGAAQSGWTSYPPLSVIAPAGQTGWLVGMIFLITSSLLGSVNFIVTIVQLRAKGLSYMRLPFFVWAQLVTAFLLLLAFPPLEAAGVLQLMDRLAGTSFFLPSGLVVTNQVLTGMTGVADGTTRAGGGNALLWQHLFWFLAHPEVGGRERYRADFEQALQAALERMPARDRALLRLHLIGGMTVENVGRMFGIAQPTASRQLAKARTALLKDSQGNVTRAYRRIVGGGRVPGGSGRERAGRQPRAAAQGRVTSRRSAITPHEGCDCHYGPRLRVLKLSLSGDF